MKNQNKTPTQAVTGTPPRRRFLMNLLASSTALPLISSVVFAQKPNRLGKDAEGNAQGRRRGAAGMQMDPTKIAARLIKEHDKDGDGALNEKELGAALTALREMRGQGMRGREGQGREGMRPGAKGQGGMGQRGMRNEDKGVEPKRPGE